MIVIDGNKIERDVEVATIEDYIKIQTNPISKRRYLEASEDQSHRAISPFTFEPFILYDGKAFSLDVIQNWIATSLPPKKD